MRSPGGWPRLGDLHFATLSLQQQDFLHLRESVLGMVRPYCFYVTNVILMLEVKRPVVANYEWPAEVAPSLPSPVCVDRLTNLLQNFVLHIRLLNEFF